MAFDETAKEMLRNDADRLVFFSLKAKGKPKERGSNNMTTSSGRDLARQMGIIYDLGDPLSKMSLRDSSFTASYISRSQRATRRFDYAWRDIDHDIVILRSSVCGRLVGRFTITVVEERSDGIRLKAPGWTTLSPRVPHTVERELYCSPLLFLEDELERWARTCSIQSVVWVAWCEGIRPNIPSIDRLPHFVIIFDAETPFLHPVVFTLSGVSVRMSSQLPYIQGVIFFVLFIIIFYTSLEVFRIPLKFSTPHIQQYDVNWKGWSNIDKIFSFGDSYTATNFELTKQQPRPENPFGNPTYDSKSPYLRWIHYLTMTYNESTIETYNFAVHGATVDKGLIDRGSAFSTQVGEKFLPHYGRQGTRVVGDKKQSIGSWRRRSKSRSNKNGPLANWDPETTLFSVWFGINDNVFSNRSEVLFDRVFESYNRTLHQLRTAGAQNFILLNVPPIHRGPNEPSNSPLARSIPSWNARLANLAAEFGSMYSETSVFLFDTYDLFNQILDAPNKFEQTRHLGNLKDQCDEYVGDLASQEMYERECGLPYDQYFWRDGLHVTFPVHQALADGVAGLLRKV